MKTCKTNRRKPPYRFRIIHTWPDGKYRYRTTENLTANINEATTYEYDEAYDIVHNKSKTARIVWGIKTKMRHI